MRCDVPVRRISRPSTMIFSGASAPRAPATRISKCTVSPTAASELFKTAVTLGESAYASCALAKTPRTANNLRQCVRISFYQLSTINSRGFTSPYRHGALLCVHQVEPAPPRLSSIPEELPPGVRSSGPPFRVRLRQLVRSRQAVASVICLRRLPSLHPQISWILQESRKVSYFPLHPLLGMVRGFHFLLRPGSAILHLAVLLARVKAVDLVACRLPAKEKESRQVAPVFFAVRSSPGLGRFFPVADLSDFQTCLVIADLGTAAGLFAAARPDLVVAADSVVSVVAVFAAGSAPDPACSVCPVYSVRSSAAATGKGRAVLVFYSSVLRSSASRNRNCPSLPCFADRA